MIQHKLVQFGAGKIGRSFIGQLFSSGGYEVVFIDAYKPVIDELNIRRNYNVIIKDVTDTLINIKNVRGVYASDRLKVTAEIANAEIVAVSIGQAGLPAIMPLLAAGLILRFKLHGNKPLDIIIAENLRNAGEYFRNELLKYIPVDYPFDTLVGLVETSIGKMVPMMLKKDLLKDILQVFAEKYNTLILDKKAFKNPIPAFAGIAPKENMKAWVDRKLFIHNLGHATTAYLGYVYKSDIIYLYEALEVPLIKNIVKKTMLQAASILEAKYPGEFPDQHLEEHIDDLIYRFQNKALGDTIYRVGCDLHRKLGADDRLAGAIHLALELKQPYGDILLALCCGCRFKASDENGNRFAGDIEVGKIYATGIKNVMTQIAGFSEPLHRNLIDKAKMIDLKISNDTITDINHFLTICNT